MSLKGQSAIVTGGAVGLGRSFATELARNGATVTICDIREDLEQTVDDLRDQGLDVHAVSADVAIPEDVRRVVDEVVRRTGAVDVLINNAATVRVTDPLDPWEKALDDYEHVMAINVKGVYMFGRAVMPIMVRAGAGNIVNVASDHIHTCGWPAPVDHSDAHACPWKDERRRPGWVGLDIYDGSKWALNGLTQNWARSLRPHGIRVNSLCMGATDSYMQRQFFGFDYDKNPPAPELLAKWIDPQRLAGLVIELIEEGPAGRSGDNIGVWMGHPTVLPAPSAVLNLRPDYSSDEMVAVLTAAYNATTE
jgi:3-oxoacyl-[acyl-carrier protein] reductase